MKQITFAILAFLFTPPGFADLDELNHDIPLASLEYNTSVPAELPRTLVMRVDAQGQVEVAHLAQRLPAKKDAKITRFKYARIAQERYYAQSDFAELNSDNSRESWYYWHNPYPVYAYTAYYAYYPPPPCYPIYYFAGYAYAYTPYYAYAYGGYYYYYFYG